MEITGQGEPASCRSVLEKKAAALMPELSGLKRHTGPDAIHDTRVQSRRLRAALEAFQDLCAPDQWSAVYESVRAITKTLGKPRESEVLPALLDELDLENDAAAVLCREYLRERLDRQNRRVRKKLRKDLREIKVKRLRSEVRSLASSVRENSRGDGLRDRFVRIVSELGEPVLAFGVGRSLARAGDRRLHRLRIAVKKLRYALEIFDELGQGDGLQGVIAQARGMQDAAGRHQDWAVLRDFLRGEIRRLTRQRTTNLAFQTGRLLRAAEDRKRVLRGQILPALAAVQAGLRLLLASEGHGPTPESAGT